MLSSADAANYMSINIYMNAYTCMNICVYNMYNISFKYV
jgi:hypothetical protein